MSTVREPKTATKTRPILISYDGSPDAARGIEAAAALLGPPRAVVVDVLPWMMSAEGLAAASSLVPGTEFEALNQLEARRFAARGAEIARSAGFRAEPSRAARSRVPAGKGSSGSPTSATSPWC